MSYVRGGQWCEGGKDSDMSDVRGGQWLQLIHIGILD